MVPCVSSHNHHARYTPCHFHVSLLLEVFLDFRHYYAAGPSQMRQLCKSINGEQMINRLSSSSCRLYVICPNSEAGLSELLDIQFLLIDCYVLELLLYT